MKNIFYIIFILYISKSLAIDYVPLSKNSKLSQMTLKAELEFIEYFKTRLNTNELKSAINDVDDINFRNYFEFYWALEVEKIKPNNNLIEGLKINNIAEASIALGLYYETVGNLKFAEKMLCDHSNNSALFFCGRLLIERRLNATKGIDILNELADSKNIDAIGVLGTYYCSIMNYNKCNRYLNRLPAEKELVYFHNLGTNYLYGRGVNKNIDKAIFYFGKSSMAGHFPSIYALGVSHFEKNNIEKSIELLRTASSGGDHRASLKLGAIFRDRAKSRDDFDESFKYLSLAEKSGYMQAYSIRLQINIVLYNVYRDEKYLKDAHKLVEDVTHIDSSHAKKLQNMLNKSIEK